MSKEEFVTMLGKTVTEKEWEMIDYVYTWHPSISNVFGKDEIVSLYRIGGMRLMRDMLQTAKKIEKLTNIRNGLQQNIKDVDEVMNALICGDEEEKEYIYLSDQMVEI